MWANEPRKKYRDKEYTALDKAKITFYKGKKVTYSVSLKPSEAKRLYADIHRTEKNPLKTSFGIIKKGDDRLEFCMYHNVIKPPPDELPSNVIDLRKKRTDSIPEKWLLFLNGEHISLEIDDWRRMFRIMNKIGHYFGILGRKKRKTG